MRANSGPTATG